MAVFMPSPGNLNPDFFRKMPLYNRAVPLYSRTVPLYDRTVPLYSRTMPLYNRAVPLYDRAVPLYSRTMPLYNRTMPLYDRAVPLYNRAVPLYDRAVPKLKLISSPPLLRRATNTRKLLNPAPRLPSVDYSSFLSSFGRPTFFNISFAFSNFLGKRTLSLKKSSDLSTSTTGFFFVLMSFSPILNQLLILQAGFQLVQGSPFK